MAQLKGKWAVVLVGVNAAVAVITLAVTGNVPITAALLLTALVTGIEAAIHYEETPQATGS